MRECRQSWLTWVWIGPTNWIQMLVAAAPRALRACEQAVTGFGAARSTTTGEARAPRANTPSSEMAVEMRTMFVVGSVALTGAAAGAYL